jgi:hypothetical protein
MALEYDLADGAALKALRVMLGVAVHSGLTSLYVAIDQLSGVSP